MKSTILKAIEYVQETNKEFLQTLMKFLVSKFVLKAYEKFQFEVCANYQLYQTLHGQVELMDN
jgi:hypothetical protein